MVRNERNLGTGVQAEDSTMQDGSTLPRAEKAKKNENSQLSEMLLCLSCDRLRVNVSLSLLFARVNF